MPKATNKQPAAAGADEDSAWLVSSIVLYYEQHRHVRVEQAEVLALTGVLTLIARNLAERATERACAPRYRRRRGAGTKAVWKCGLAVRPRPASPNPRAWEGHRGLNETLG